MPTAEEAAQKWIETRCFELLNSLGPIATTKLNLVEHGPIEQLRMDLVRMRRVQEGDEDCLIITARLFATDSEGSVVETMEHECFAGPFEARDWENPDADEAVMLRAIATWRDQVIANLSRYDGLDALEPPPHYLPTFGLTELVSLWRHEGLPPPRPQRLHLDEAVFTAAAKKLRPVQGKALNKLKRDRQRLVAAFTVGEWTLLLEPGFERGDSEEITLLAPEALAFPVLVLMRDCYQALPQCIDGDAVAFRGFTTWLSEAIIRNDLDLSFPLATDDDEAREDDQEGASAEHTMRLSDWLRFGDRTREAAGHALVDWRLQPDIVLDRPYEADDSERQRAGRALYHRFLREFIDSTFLPKDNALR